MPVNRSWPCRRAAFGAYGLRAYLALVVHSVFTHENVAGIPLMALVADMVLGFCASFLMGFLLSVSKCTFAKAAGLSLTYAERRCSSAVLNQCHALADCGI